MAKPINILLDTDTPLADFAAELSQLLDIELLPSIGTDKVYEFRAMTLMLGLRQLDAPQAECRYLISINGIFGSEEQRTKWTEDWAYSILQTLKATQKYRLKRIDQPTLIKIKPA